MPGLAMSSVTTAQKVFLIRVSLLFLWIVMICEPKSHSVGQPTLMELWKQHQDSVKPQMLGFRNFSCPYYKIRIGLEPLNVHMLRPENVGVIAALGDSITAGTGAGATSMNNVWSTAYRRLSFSIGGAESLDTVVTFPNIVRQFNPEVYGGSMASDPGLNVAVPGSRASDMTAQANELIRRLAARPHLRNQWKVVTVFIGTNDICHACYNDVEAFRQAPTFWIREIDRALKTLSSGLTKTFVNLVSVISVWQLREFEKYDGCRSCRCITSSYKYHNITETANKKYQQGIYELVGKYDRSDFTVVVQPLLSNVVYPPSKIAQGPDLSFVSPDCFHYSRRWHAAAATGLWNNIIQPIASKSNRANLTAIALLCPDPKCPYLRTSVNSIHCAENYLSTLEQALNTTSSTVETLFEEETTRGRAALWIFLFLVFAAAAAGAAICVYQRRYRRGDMDLTRMVSRHSEDPQVPLIAVHDLRDEEWKRTVA